MKEINLIIVLFFCATFSFSQKKEIHLSTTTNLIGSYYQFGSYSKERPFMALEQLVEIAPFEKIRFGLGSGFNLYPATATVPIFATVRFLTPISEKWSFYLLQSYGRNLKLGSIGFNSNRYYGDFGFPFKLNEKLTLNPSMGYLLNWDSWGGRSLGLTGGVGLTINFN